MDQVVSKGRLAAQCSQLIQKIKDDPMSYLSDEEKDLLELIVKLYKTLPSTETA